MKKYDDASKIKAKADLLEEFERNKLESEVLSILSNFPSHCEQILIVLDGFYHREKRDKAQTLTITCSCCSSQEDLKRQERTT